MIETERDRQPCCTSFPIKRGNQLFVTIRSQCWIIRQLRSNSLRMSLFGFPEKRMDIIPEPMDFWWTNFYAESRNVRILVPIFARLSRIHSSWISGSAPLNLFLKALRQSMLREKRELKTRKRTGFTKLWRRPDRWPVNRSLRPLGFGLP